MSDIKTLTAQHEALEKVVEGQTAVIKELSAQIKELKDQKAVSSVTVDAKAPEPIKNADPFEIKGVGTFKLKFPQFQIGKEVIKAVDIVKDAAALQALYEKNPSLFIPVKK